MSKKSIAHSFRMKKGMLDDDYELYEDGTIKHTYDKSQYPGGLNHEKILNINQIDDRVKNDFINSAGENIELVKKLLGI